ncbi:hypothetical protein B566_EDAN009183 [Ephemera danica]|nr:hypothetical protein B566_EDAN009183 [Ephemera danica]
MCVAWFQAPAEVTSWSGVKHATADGPVCMQKDFLQAVPVVQGQEDCLYLNVYTPKLPRPGAKEKPSLLPVMVYVHGGGFFSGSGSSTELGPEYLLARDVVLVTFNYRLGPLGFLSTGTEHIPGNAGLKDQVAALRWVHINIAKFGGDPRLVTIFGQSAGGASVHYHVLSPMSRGLFQRAIIQSGAALCAWAGMTSALAPQVTHVQATLVNCSTENTETMVRCLQDVDAAQLTWGSDPLSVYSPVIEPLATTDADTEPRFITASPYDTLRDGNISAVPLLMGVVPGEGTIHANVILSDYELVADFNSRSSELGPFILGLGLSVPEEMEREMYGDRFFLHPIHLAVEMHRSLNLAPVYLYKYSYRGSFSYEPIYSHFGTAKYYGNPNLILNSANVSPPLPNWQPLTPCEPIQFASISTSLTTGHTDFFNERLAFWNSLPLRENSMAQVDNTVRNCNTNHPEFVG